MDWSHFGESFFRWRHTWSLLMNTCSIWRVFFQVRLINEQRKKIDGKPWCITPNLVQEIEVKLPQNYATQRDLALAYSPGVALPCLEIDQEVNNVYNTPTKGNLVAVISNGTAVLGLGDLDPKLPNL